MKEDDNSPSKEDFEALIRESLSFVDSPMLSSEMGGKDIRTSRGSFGREKVILIVGLTLFFILVNVGLVLSANTVFPLKGGGISSKQRIIHDILNEKDRALSDVISKLGSDWDKVFSDGFPASTPKYVQTQGGLLMLCE